MYSPGVGATAVSGGLFPQHRCSGQVSGNQEKEFPGWGHCLLTNCSKTHQIASAKTNGRAEHLPLGAQAKEARALNAYSHHFHTDPSLCTSTLSKMGFLCPIAHLCHHINFLMVSVPSLPPHRHIYSCPLGCS